METNNDQQSSSSMPTQFKETLEQLIAATKARMKDDANVDPEVMEEITLLITSAMTMFSDYQKTYSPSERSRKISAGIKNLGFIETAYPSALNNPIYVPPYITIEEFRSAIEDLMLKRDLVALLKQFEQEASDSMLNSADKANHFALTYYNSVKEAAKQKIPGAEAEYKILSKYFKKTKHASEESMDEQNEGAI